MAIVDRNYVVRGPQTAVMQQFGAQTANVLDRYPIRMIKVSVDDTEIDDLDRWMLEQGYEAEISEPVLEIFERPTQPAQIVGIARTFGRNANGGTQLFVRTGDGKLVQLTPHQSSAGFVNGCVPSYVSASVVQISAGTVRDKTDNMDLVLAAPANVDIAVAGVGGLDTGVEAANQWYYLFVIGDTTGANPVAVIMSTASGAPTYPPGYDVSRRVGSVRNQGSDFRDFVVNGDNVMRDVQYRDAITGRQVLAAGAAEIVTEINLVNYIPGPSRVARLQCAQNGTVEGRLYFDPALALATYQRAIGAGRNAADLVMPTSSTRRVAYANAAAGGLLDVWVTGYQESI